MIVLGIESTAHTFGVGIINEKKILANEKDIYTTKKGGMIPVRVADHHFRVCDKIIKRALSAAQINLSEVEIISFSQAPGIGNTLRVGAIAARSLALNLEKPIIGVNHCIAHLEIARLLFPEAKDPVLLYVSGANTQVIAYDGGKYRIFGETLDIGVGNFLDSFARYAGIGFPGGPVIEKLAKQGNTYIELPYCVKGMDVNFGGILTNLRNKLRTKKYRLEDLAYSVQETVFPMLIEVSERAMAHCEKDELVLGGGVACNKRLQEMARIMCRERGASCYIPDNQLLVDNAVMIAWLGLVEYESGIRMKIENTGIKPYERTDDVEVTWRS